MREPLVAMTTRLAAGGVTTPDIRPRGCAITAKADMSKSAVTLMVRVIDADGFQLIAARSITMWLKFRRAFGHV